MGASLCGSEPARDGGGSEKVMSADTAPSRAGSLPPGELKPYSANPCRNCANTGAVSGRTPRHR